MAAKKPRSYNPRLTPKGKPADDHSMTEDTRNLSFRGSCVTECKFVYKDES